MHGLKGGRWGGDHDLDRDGRETFGPALDVKETGVLSQPAYPHHGFRNSVSEGGSLLSWGVVP